MPFSFPFQSPSSIPSFIIQELHDLIMFYLIPIFLITLYFLFSPSSSYTPTPSLEFYWTIMPLLIVSLILIPSSISLMITLPSLSQSYPIFILSSQWSWSSSSTLYTPTPSLLISLPFMYIPTSLPTLFYLTSLDVIHTFSIPSLSIKTDCIPGSITSLTLSPLIPSIYLGQCQEYCGTYHHAMPILLVSS